MLIAAAVLCCCLAAGGAVLANRIRSDAAGNAALADPAATRQVADTVRHDLAEVFSYTYANLDTAASTADRVLVGDARARYRKLLPSLRAQAAGDHLVQQTTVRAVAVERLHGDSARLLVFLDQQRLHAGSDDRSSTTGMEVSARRVDGHWKIAAFSFQGPGRDAGSK